MQSFVSAGLAVRVRRCGETIWRRCAGQGRDRRAGGRGAEAGIERGGGQGSCAGREGGIKTGRDGIDPRRRFARISELVVDLDEFDLRELFEAGHQRTRDVVKRAIRLAVPGQVYMHPAVQSLYPGVTREAIGDDRQPLVPFHVAGTLKELIQDGVDPVHRRGHKTFHCYFVRKLSGDQPFIVGEVHIDLDELRCTRGRRHAAWCGGEGDGRRRRPCCGWRQG